MSDSDAATVRELEAVIAEVATGLWRLTARLGDAPERDRRPVERLVEVLADRGIRVHDPRDRPFHPGLPVEVVAYQPTPGIREETVIDVERPTVYRGASVLQRARVVVGVPDEEVGTA
ncbi:hypothetical protein [Cryptosporangium arvum]|uniref:Molecular chaperone GrpE (Heat shock protein) n=1 Tax=Cryptosporangium arvum DSM 44712 TaxID=927661 RepID=A0A010ZZ86_9ACTN|nr:hypothetical protein [Cryptosporangium arvum]EXG82532.1 hypothetical protein CryarDRAFT_3723 [Cryptosporangium arvum DSM 44712]